MLHGRGGDAQSIMPLADQLFTNDFHVVAPQASNNSWYPQSFMVEEKFNEPSLSLSISNIKNLIDEIVEWVPKNRIYLIGFSQGACLSLEVSTRFATKYGGIIAFTGGLIGHTIDETKYHGNFEGTKVFISNGDQDPHIPLSRSEQSKILIEKLGADVTLQIYPGRPHIITPDEIKFVKTNILSLNQ